MHPLLSLLFKPSIRILYISSRWRYGRAYHFTFQLSRFTRQLLKSHLRIVVGWSVKCSELDHELLIYFLSLVSHPPTSRETYTRQFSIYWPKAASENIPHQQDTQSTKRSFEPKETRYYLSDSVWYKCEDSIPDTAYLMRSVQPVNPLCIQ